MKKRTLLVVGSLALMVRSTSDARYGDELFDLFVEFFALREDLPARSLPDNELATDLAHPAANYLLSFGQIVPLGLIAHDPANPISDLGVGRACAERGPKVVLAIGHQARTQEPVVGQPDAVAP